MVTKLLPIATTACHRTQSFTLGLQKELPSRSSQQRLWSRRECVSIFKSLLTFLADIQLHQEWVPPSFPFFFRKGKLLISDNYRRTRKPVFHFGFDLTNSVPYFFITQTWWIWIKMFKQGSAGPVAGIMLRTFLIGSESNKVLLRKDTENFLIAHSSYFIAVLLLSVYTLHEFCWAWFDVEGRCVLSEENSISSFLRSYLIPVFHGGCKREWFSHFSRLLEVTHTCYAWINVT